MVPRLDIGLPRLGDDTPVLRLCVASAGNILIVVRHDGGGGKALGVLGPNNNHTHSRH